MEPGSRFCNACGAPVGAKGGTTGGGGGDGRSGGASSGTGEHSRLVWGVAGVFLVGLILAVAIPAVRQQEQSSRPAVPAPSTGGAAAGGGPVDISQMTPRQRADLLYERIMTASSAGDSTGAAFFIPMGLQAYDMARPLDADGYFHLALLQRMAGDPASALATAREALAAQPNHLLLLAVAGGAAVEIGETDAAGEYYRRYLDAYDEERARGLTEYELHAAMFEELTEEAESFLASS